MLQSLSIPNLLTAVTVVAAAVIGLADPFGVGASSAALALTVLTIGLWATGVVAEYKTALLFFTLAMLFSVVPAEVTFAGFNAGATWLIFSGLVIGVGVNSSGLGERIAKRLASLFGGGYRRAILGVLLGTLVLGFIMPSSMGRVVLLMPIAVALAKELGYEPDEAGYTGVVLAAGFGCFFMPFGILPANIPNVVMHGLVEELFGFSLIYGDWFALHFPLISLFKTALLWGLIVLLFPGGNTAAGAADELSPMSPVEWRLTGILVGAVLAWATDFIHHVSPAWVGMAAAMLCMTPRIGNVTAPDFARINFSVLFYVAAILGIGAMVNHSGLGRMLADNMIGLLPLSDGQAFWNFMTVALTGMAVETITAAPGLPVLMTPMAEQLAASSGFSLPAILMIQALSFSTPYLVYQSAPIVVAMGLADVRLADGTKLISALAVLTVLTIFPLAFLWWRVLGWV